MRGLLCPTCPAGMLTSVKEIWEDAAMPPSAWADQFCAFFCPGKFGVESCQSKWKNLELRERGALQGRLPGEGRGWGRGRKERACTKKWSG